MPRLQAIATIAVFVTSSLAACGGANGPADTVDPTSPPVPTPVDGGPAQQPSSAPDGGDAAGEGGLAVSSLPKVSLGFSHGCAAKANGTVVCWGTNADGRLGDGTTTYRRLPVAVPGVTDAIDVAAGDSFSCALRKGGTVVCWGNAQDGRLGAGAQVTGTQLAPVTVVGLVDAIAIANAAYVTCALRKTGTVVCWGRNLESTLGVSATSRTFADEPIAIEGLEGVVALTGARFDVCALDKAGEVYCWGRNDSYQLARTGGDTPGAVKIEGITGATMVGVMDTAACAMVNGKALCWGYVQGLKRTPTPLPALDGASMIGRGHDDLCGVVAGTVVCVPSSTSESPTTIDGITDAVSVVSSYYQLTVSCAVHATGAVSAWGTGELGSSVPPTNFSRTPVPVANLP